MEWKSNECAQRAYSGASSRAASLPNKPAQNLTSTPPAEHKKLRLPFAFLASTSPNLFMVSQSPAAHWTAANGAPAHAWPTRTVSPSQPRSALLTLPFIKRVQRALEDSRAGKLPYLASLGSFCHFSPIAARTFSQPIKSGCVKQTPIKLKKLTSIPGLVKGGQCRGWKLIARRTSIQNCYTVCGQSQRLLLA